MIKIFKDISWRGKKLVMTWHFYREWEELHKPLEFVVVILAEGKHTRISKRANKYSCTYPWKGKELNVVYVEQEEYILIHIKPRNKK